MGQVSATSWQFTCISSGGIGRHPFVVSVSSIQINIRGLSNTSPTQAAKTVAVAGMAAISTTAQSISLHKQSAILHCQWQDRPPQPSNNKNISMVKLQKRRICMRPLRAQVSQDEISSSSLRAQESQDEISSSSSISSNSIKKQNKKEKAAQGIFAPLVIVTRNIIGKKRFNQLRGKAIALHSQVITEFCKSIGADSKQRQGLIRLAKKNGEKLGFLA